MSNWMSLYRPPNPELWIGRWDDHRYHQHINFVDLREQNVPAGSQVLIGFACDEGVRRNHGRPGAVEGPDTFRQVLSGLPWHKKNKLVDGGTVFCEAGPLESAQEALGKVVAEVLKQGARPLVIGGGHETAWGHFQGIQNAGKDKGLGILNFDAHFDLRPLEDGKGSSGTPFRQIAESIEDFHYFVLGVQSLGNTSGLFNVAQSTQTRWLSANQMFQSEGLDQLQSFIDQQSHLYLSICMDVFSAAHAPGVSAPQPFGLAPWHVLPYLGLILGSGKVLCMDIVELCPPLDRDRQTARLAASILDQIMD